MKLNEIFKDPIRIRNIYDIAEEISPNNPKLIQQRGIYEMISNDGSIFSAQKLFKKANSLAPDDIMISHSLAEISIRKAENSNNLHEKKQFLNEVPSSEFVAYAQTIAHELNHCVIAQTDGGEKSHILISPEGDVEKAGLTKEETMYYAVESGLYNCHKITCR